MGRTQVEAAVIGPESEGSYTFLADTGSTHVGLPVAEIERLNLYKLPGGTMRVLTAQGTVEYDSYAAYVRIDGNTTAALVLPSPIPLIGYEVLENLRLKVNPVTGELEPVPPEEPSPPYQLFVSSPVSRAIS